MYDFVSRRLSAATTLADSDLLQSNIQLPLLRFFKLLLFFQCINFRIIFSFFPWYWYTLFKVLFPFCHMINLYRVYAFPTFGEYGLDVFLAFVVHIAFWFSELRCFRACMSQAQKKHLNIYLKTPS